MKNYDGGRLKIAIIVQARSHTTIYGIHIFIDLCLVSMRLDRSLVKYL
jgi:hypothetical protein